MRKLFLNSDFRDCYDWWFASKSDTIGPRDVLLDRPSRSHRCSDFAVLQNNRLHTPPFGRVSTLLETYPHQDLVVYTDPEAHAGEGKELMDARTAYSLHGGKYATPFIFSGEVGDMYASSLTPKVSYRKLWIGYHQFLLEYKSNDGWRSNTGEVEITYSTGFMNTYRIKEKYPIYAIDYIKDVTLGLFWAIDFNCSPSISGTPIADSYKPKEIYDMIEEYIFGELRSDNIISD